MNEWLDYVFVIESWMKWNQKKLTEMLCEHSQDCIFCMLENSVSEYPGLSVV
jgi:hypothetical protein